MSARGETLGTWTRYRAKTWADLGIEVCPLCGSRRPYQRAISLGGCPECNREYQRRWKATKAGVQARARSVEIVRGDSAAQVRNRARSRLGDARRKGRAWAQYAAACTDCARTSAEVAMTADHHRGYDGENWKLFETVCLRCNILRRNKI